MKNAEIDFTMHSGELMIQKKGDRVVINVWEPQRDGSKNLAYFYNNEQHMKKEEEPGALLHATPEYQEGADKYFDLFHGGEHGISEMGVAEPVIQGLLRSKRILGQHEFIPQSDGSVREDIRLSVPEEVRKRQIRNELKDRINELKSMLPEEAKNK